MIDLSEDILDRDLKPACSLADRLKLFQVSRLFKKIMAENMPRQTVVELRNNAPVAERRAIAPRLSTEPPCVEEYDAPVRMRRDAESELSVVFGTCWTAKPMQDVLDRVVAVAERMRLRHAQPVQALYLSCTPLSDVPMRDVMRGLPPIVRDSIHTLCARHPAFPGFSQKDMMFPFHEILTFPAVTTVRLHNTAADIKAMSMTIPMLRSLQLTSCPQITGWNCLSTMTRLRDLTFVATMHQQDSGVGTALTAIGEATWLSSIRLPWIGAEGCAALTAFTNLDTLVLGMTSLQTDMQRAATQANLELIAGRSPDLRRLDLASVPGMRVPAMWTHLEELCVLNQTPIPQLSSIRKLVIGKTLGMWDDTSLPFPRLPALPPHLRSLHASYNALPSAVGCTELEQLAWTRASHDSDFQLRDHVALLASLTSDVWPRLHSLLILHEEPVYKVQVEDREVQIIYNAQLLETLASRSVSRIGHVTLHQNEPGTGTFETLCKMQLRSVTLIGMRVNVMRLRSILRQPSMRLLELVGVSGVDVAQIAQLRKEARGSCRVHCIKMSELDVGGNGVAVDKWSF